MKWVSQESAKDSVLGYMVETCSPEFPTATQLRSARQGLARANALLARREQVTPSPEAIVSQPQVLCWLAL
nr:hypothetical protein CJ225_03655 [Gardnerella vaginalis]